MLTKQSLDRNKELVLAIKAKVESPPSSPPKKSWWQFITNGFSGVFGSQSLPQNKL